MDREIKKEVTPYEVNISCIKCSFGFMLPTGITYMTNPPQYEHKCNKCENKENFTLTYPYIIHL
jgi:hypothetical protein